MSEGYAVMRRNEQLVRRARIRAVLNRRSGKDGIATQEELAEIIGCEKITIHRDLTAIGAVKVSDTIDGRTYSWWIVPSWNPLLPDYRESMDETAMLNEISLKIRAHVIEMFVFGNEIVVKTERSAGPLLADWLSLLPWPEIVHVSEERSACVIKTPDAESAGWVRARLTGENEPVEEA